MDLLNNEKELSKHGSLIITNHRLNLGEKEFIKYSREKIPLHKIDSVSFEYRRDISVILIGILLISMAFLFNFWFPSSSQFWFLLMVFGFVTLLIGIILKKEFVEFASCSIKIREEKKDIEDFINVVREEIYRNNLRKL